MGEPVGVREVPGRAALDPLRIPAALERWRATVEGAAWLDALPQHAADLAGLWQLELGDPYPGNVGLVLRAVRADGTRAVLKFTFSDEESEHEGDALRFWPGEAAVRVLEHDRRCGAILLERCEPGTTLWSLPEEEALAVAAHVVEQLAGAGDPGPPFRRLDEEAPRWIDELADRPFDPPLLDEALAALRELASTQRGVVLCSEDFHGGNVLLSQRGWLAIDPKPIVAELEFGLVSLIRDRRPVDAPTVRHRLDFLSAELGLDRERIRRWSLAHALWWGFEGDELHPEHVAAARLLTK